MDELMQRDEDSLVQQRLHSDRHRRASTVVEVSGDVQTPKWSDQVCRQGVAEKHLVTKAHESPREHERKLREEVDRPSCLCQENRRNRHQKMPKRDEV